MGTFCAYIRKNSTLLDPWEERILRYQMYSCHWVHSLVFYQCIREIILSSLTINLLTKLCEFVGSGIGSISLNYYRSGLIEKVTKLNTLDKA